MNVQVKSFLSSTVAAIIIFIALSPIGEPGSGFNTDVAIPWMMAHSNSFTPFDWYYYGQNRFGSWPFLFTKTLTWIFSEPFVPELFFRCLVFFSSVNLILQPILNEKARWLIFTLFTALMLNDKTVYVFFFTIAQPYLVQLTMIFIYFYISKKSGFLLKSFVAILLSWLNPTSLVYLAAIEGFNFLQKFIIRNYRIKDFLRILILLTTFLPPLIGFATERFMNFIYLWYVKSKLLPNFSEKISMDTGTISDLSLEMALNWGFINVIKNLIDSSPKILAGIVLFISCIYISDFLLKQRKNIKSLVKDPIFNYIALATGSILNMFLMSMSVWAALNSFKSRYICTSIVLNYLLLSILTYLAIQLLAKKANLRLRLLNPPLKWIALFSTCLMAMMVYPKKDEIKRNWKSFHHLKKSAEEIAKLNTTVLLGSYWQSYVWQGLLPSIRAIPVDAFHIRQPNSIFDYRLASTILYCHSNSPPEILNQYNKSWQLVEPNILLNNLCAISKYKLVSGQ